MTLHYDLPVFKDEYQLTLRLSELARLLTGDTRKCRQGSCVYTGVVSANNCTCEAGAIYQGAIVKNVAGRVSTFAKAILGTAYVGQRVILHNSG